MPMRSDGRYFNLSDAIILIAAVAVGLALAKPATDTLAARKPALTGTSVAPPPSCVLLFGTPTLAACALATVGISLRRPRPSLPHLARSPGFIANASGLLGVAFACLHYLVQVLIGFGSAPMKYVHLLALMIPGSVAYFVMGAALAMALRGDWLPRPTWVDWLGWVFGLAWIGLALFSWVKNYVDMLR
jgi:hypothetical protein